jgi:hypothetical protein
MGKRPLEGYQGKGYCGSQSYGKHCSYVYVLKCTYALRRANELPMTIKLKRFVKPYGLDLALTNCNQWFHVDASPASSSPWARDLLEMSVIKTVQFTYCVGYTMRGRSWNANGGWTEREVEEFKTGILGFLFKLSQ